MRWGTALFGIVLVSGMLSSQANAQDCAGRAAIKLSNCSSNGTSSQTCNATYGAELAACRQAALAQQQQQAAALAEQQRQAIQRVNDLREREGLKVEIAKYTPAWLESASDGDLDGAHGSIERSLVRLKAITVELGEAPSPEADGIGQKLLAAIDAAVLRAKACRADAKCTAARAAKKVEAAFFDATVGPMCQADQMRENALATMARERANPSGFVNKVVLHDAGADVQTAQDLLKQLGPSYLKVRRHAWPGWRKECSPASP